MHSYQASQWRNYGWTRWASRTPLESLEGRVKGRKREGRGKRGEKGKERQGNGENGEEKKRNRKLYCKRGGGKLKNLEQKGESMKMSRGPVIFFFFFFFACHLF